MEQYSMSYGQFARRGVIAYSVIRAELRNAWAEYPSMGYKDAAYQAASRIVGPDKDERDYAAVAQLRNNIVIAWARIFDLAQLD